MTEHAVQKRPCNPPAEAWLAIKPIFLDLYLRQDKTLNEVRRHLETRYSFIASTKAYKLRVKQWAAFKYRKRQAGHARTTSAKWFVNRQKPSAAPTNRKGQILSFSNSTPVDGFEAAAFTNRMIRMDQRVHDTSGYLLANTRDLWQWTIRSDLSPKMDHVWSTHIAPGWALLDVVTLLSMPARHQQGQKKLLQVQESITSYIHAAPAATLIGIICLFTFIKWRPYPGVQTVLFNFIRDYALRNLPQDNPLRKLLIHAKSDDMRLAAGQVLVIQVDTLMQLEKSGDEVPDWFYFGPTWGLLQAGLISDAHRLTIKRLHQTESKLKRCRLLQMIIRGQFYGHDYESTIQRSLSILPMINELLAEGEFMWGDLVSTYDLMAKSYANKCQWDKAIEYSRLAFENAFQQFGQHSTNVQYYCHELEDTLNNHGTPEELEQLTSKYSCMFLDEPTSSPASTEEDQPGTSKAHLLTGHLTVESGPESLIAGRTPYEHA